MKVLLIASPYHLLQKKQKSKVTPMEPPLGLATIAAYLEKNNVEVRIIDAFLEDSTIVDFKKAIKKYDPDIIGLAPYDQCARFGNIAVNQRIVSALKGYFPKKKIGLVWSHYPNVFVNALKENKDMDFVILGDGEPGMLNLIKAYSGRIDFKDAKGIAYRKGNEVYANEPGFLENLDEIPFPARHLLKMNRYIPRPHRYRKLPMDRSICSRGCPYRCLFCSRCVLGKKYRTRSPEHVVKEIKLLKKQYGIREIRFMDDVLTLNRKWIEKLCNLMIKEKLNISWNCLTRVDLVDKSILKLMKKAGCWNIFYGIESNNPKILGIIKKDITIKQIRDAVKWTKEVGIEIRASFMIGLPGETPEIAKNLVRFAIELDPDYAQFHTTMILPDTGMNQILEKYGTVKEWVQLYQGIPGAVFLPKAYKNVDELFKMRQYAFRKFYLRPRFIIKKIFDIKSFSDIKRYLKGFMILFQLKKVKKIK